MCHPRRNGLMSSKRNPLRNGSQARSCQRKRKGEKDERPQSERFKETARQLGVDESGDKFEQAFKKIVPEKKGTDP